MERKRSLKLWVRIVILCVLIMCFLISIISMISIILNSKNNNTIPIYLYNINRSADYTVDLYDNSFINENKQEQNKTYISELVKNIDVNFMYNYSGSNVTNLKYTYSIIGELSANYTTSDNSTKEVWNKTITYKEKTKEEIMQKSGFVISEKINIDYPELRQEVINFKRQFNMNVSVNMDIYMTIDVTGICNGVEINDSSKILLKIPFGVQAFSIEKDFEATSNEEILGNLGVINQFNIKNLLTPISILIIVFLSFIILFKPLFNIKRKNKYTIKLDKILKSYGDVVAEVEKRVSDKGYEVVKVKNITDMISIQEELRIPITFYEIRPNYLAEFVIIYNNIMYKYLLKND